ncbi:PDT-domain-containing protein [Agrocybe pediades]|nr:PDT-domain-containing protein [Agrocybe pediades]
MQVAVLGPLGTYTHEAALKVFGDSATFNEKSSIADVLNGLSIEVPFGVIPQENSIFGPVVETYDRLRSTEKSFVRGEMTLEVEHCLLVKRGVQISQVRRVMSHEQALGQCCDFIEEKMPWVQKIKTPSTAAAAKALLDNEDDCAAICSSICATIFAGLEVLFTGIQNERSNFTRFYVVAHSQQTEVPKALSIECHMRALIRLSAPPKPDISYGVMQYLKVLDLDATRIDRRPSVEPIPFQSTYFVEVQASNTNALTRETGLDLWAKEVEHSVAKVAAIGGQADIIGLW